MKETDNNLLKEKALFSFNPLMKEDFYAFQEVFSGKVYETGGVVREGDVVLDLGASIGDFAFSIRDNKPKHIYCVEPDPSLCELLKINTKGSPVTIIPKAIVGERGLGLCIFNDQGDKQIVGSPDYEGAKTTFKDLVEDYEIDFIDFLKIDIEGGEYNVFTKENIDFLTTKVNVIVCEFHINVFAFCPNSYFIYFRDTILPHFHKYAVTSVTYRDFSVQPEELNFDIKSEGFEDKYSYATIWIYNKGGMKYYDGHAANNENDKVPPFRGLYS
jgi:FkbM family methyltransferase